MLCQMEAQWRLRPHVASIKEIGIRVRFPPRLHRIKILREPMSGKARELRSPSGYPQTGGFMSESREPQFLVVFNHEEQYSICRVDQQPLPLGWSAEGFQGSREACLEHIGKVWTDMTPKSLRKAAKQ
jgi:MbtH protein